jgi:hypothetical protein
VELAVGRAAGTTSIGKVRNCRTPIGVAGYGVFVLNVDVGLVSADLCHREVKQLQIGRIFWLLDNVSTNSKCD